MMGKQKGALGGYFCPTWGEGKSQGTPPGQGDGWRTGRTQPVCVCGRVHASGMSG